ncbi:MAG: hypothetical protein AAGD11_09225 [Planctomycetota bacterium]
MKTTLILGASLLLGLATLGAESWGQVTVLDTDFTAAEGFADGNLQFQNGWLGQNLPQVDSTGTGTVSITGGFQRNIFNVGALGGMAGGDGSAEGGGASHPQPAGFNIGDVLRIEHVYSFDLDNVAGNVGLLQTGVRPNFVLGGFEAGSVLGTKVDYNSFEDGSLKVFSSFARLGFNGADNPFALFIEPLDVGVDNGWDGVAYTNPTDFVSDKIKFTWEAVYDGADTWTATEMIVENVDTATVLGIASVDNPDALETVTVAGSGSEAFLGMHQVRGSNSTGSTDAVTFTYTSSVAGPEGDFDGDGDVDGADFLKWQQDGLTPADLQAWQTNYGQGVPALASLAAVPEPSAAALCLFGVAAICQLRRRS